MKTRTRGHIAGVILIMACITSCADFGHIAEELQLSESALAQDIACFEKHKMSCLDIGADGGGLLYEQGYLYLLMGCRVIQLDVSSGFAKVLAGNSNCSILFPKCKDGIGENASFSYPRGITKVGGYLYISDTRNNKIRRINIETEQVITIAGNEERGYRDGAGADALFNEPMGLVTDGSNLYLADTGNSVIRKIDLRTNEVTTLSLNDSDKEGISSQLRRPYALSLLDEALYVADTYNHKIRKIDIKTGYISNVAGKGSSLFSHSGDGVGAEAYFYYPKGITTDGKNIYIADTRNKNIRLLDPQTLDISTIVGGSGLDSYWQNGIGRDVKFRYPTDMTYHDNTLYVLDGTFDTFTKQGFVRKIDTTTLEVTTVPGYLGEPGTIIPSPKPSLNNRFYVGGSVGSTIVNIKTDYKEEKTTTSGGTVSVGYYFNEHYGIEAMHGYNRKIDSKSFSGEQHDSFGNGVAYEFDTTSLAFLAHYYFDTPDDKFGFLSKIGIMRAKTYVSVSTWESYYTRGSERIYGSVYNNQDVDFSDPGALDEYIAAWEGVEYVSGQSLRKDSSVEYVPYVSAGLYRTYLKHFGFSFDLSYYQFSPKLLNQKHDIYFLSATVGVDWIF